MRKLKWIESGGGPLLLVAKPLFGQWTGMRPSKTQSGVTDAQRARAVTQDIAVIPLGTAHAVVLGDEPDKTAVLPEPKVLYLVRCRWADSDKALLRALDTGLERLPFAHAADFPTLAGDHFLFDSAYGASDNPNLLSVVLQASEYAIDSAYLAPTDNVCALIHRLRPRRSDVTLRRRRTAGARNADAIGDYGLCVPLPGNRARY